jgi:hypothetical protein
MSATKTWAITAAGAAVLLGAETALAQYSFIIIAEANDPDRILTGSLNDNGDAVYALAVDQDPRPDEVDLVPAGIFRCLAPAYDCGDPLTDSIALSGTGPVLNDDGWVAFIGIDGQDPGIYLYDDVVPDPERIFSTDPSKLDFVGQLAINSPDALVAFWYLQLAQSPPPPDPPTPTTHFIRTVNPGGVVIDVATATSPASLAGPAINDNGDVAYLESSGQQSLAVHISSTAEPLFNVSFTDVGLLSVPSVNASGTVAVFVEDQVADPPITAGIYTKTAGDPAQRRVGLSVPGGLAPAQNSLAIVNDDNELAYLASFTGIQMILTGEDPAPEILVTDGDEIDGAQVVDGTLELFGFNNCEQVLFKAGLEDDRNVLVLATSVVVCSDFDLDGDGVVGVTDFLALLAAWGTSPGGPPDFDGDGTVGVTDFLALLANWT